ncbi:MAG: hypothetical protein ABIJ12_12360, partial [bacterium]
NDEFIVLGNVTLMYQGDNIPDPGIYLTKYTSSGTQLWSKTYNNQKCFGRCVQETSDNGFIICGYAYDFGGVMGSFIMKTDSLGNKIWAKVYEMTGFQYEPFKYGLYSTRQTSDGGYLAAGYDKNTQPSFIVWKFDSAGDSVWARKYPEFGSEGGGRAYSLELTFDGGFIASGFESSNSYYIVRADSNGDTLWTKSGIYGEDKGLYAMTKTDDGGFAFAGYDHIATDNIFIERIAPESCCILRGDVAPPKDGAVLVNDQVYLLNFLFRGGPPPECMEEGDCAIPLDGNILVNDLVWLVNYLFKGGPPPPEC